MILLLKYPTTTKTSDSANLKGLQNVIPFDGAESMGGKRPKSGLEEAGQELRSKVGKGNWVTG